MGGNVDASYTLGVEYLTGATFANDEEKGMYWLQQAAQSLPAAQLRYAMYLATASNEQLRDPAQAQAYLARVDAGHPDKLTLYEVKAAVAAALGQFDDAQKWQNKVLKEADKLELDTQYYAAQLERYQAGQIMKL